MNRIILGQYRLLYLYALRHTSSKISKNSQFDANLREGDFKHPPGYILPHMWMKPRPADKALKSLVFGPDKKEFSVDEKKYLSFTSHARVSGPPVTEDFSYEIANNINEIPVVDQKLLNNLKTMGLFDLTPIQKHAVGIMSVDEYERANVNINEFNQSMDDSSDGCPPYERVTGKFDLMAAAQTGSGKTLAYLIPSLNRLLRVYPYEAMQSLLNSCSSCQYPSSLILAPTRELVQQILSELLKLCNQTFVRAVAVYGGERPDKQLFELSKGCHLVVATPGRLLDFLHRGAICLQYCRSLILDEADRMLDMGFEKQIRQIIESPTFKMPPPKESCRQTVLFSATYPREVTLLANDFLRGSRCVSLTLSNPESNSGTIVPTWGESVRNNKENELERLTRTIPKEINQQIQVVDGNPNSAIPSHLLKLIEEIKSQNTHSENVCRILVFCNTKLEVDHFDRYLHSKGVQSAAIHGDKPQFSRTKALNLFRKGTVCVLVASSVRCFSLQHFLAIINTTKCNSVIWVERNWNCLLHLQTIKLIFTIDTSMFLSLHCCELSSHCHKSHICLSNA
ncbi:ATP-dependent RNA helicase DDX3Y isoform 3 [Schistosoma japonicum]|uniref:RNA helicase n=1 Tax=Schistosoma japonicum TaxID=6182 RepID=A0A4Z2CV88_SCHJA|nr:ATP-dependent RNA helicase DDX3Y isoform 3 [Schistosoma japonicum]